MSDEIKAIRQKHSAELLEWIEARVPEFLDMLGGPKPELAGVEDFRLVLCIVDAADADACTYYPIVDSGSSFHRQLGLVEQSGNSLRLRTLERDED